MKKLFLLLALPAAIISCSNSDDDSCNKLNQINASGIITQTRAPINSDGSNLPLTTQSVYFVRTHDSATADWTTVTGNQTVSVGNAGGVLSGTMSTDGTITLSPSQFYHENSSLNSYLTGYYPASNATYPSVTNPGKLQWTIDGKTDIMYTGIASGNKTGSATPMAFTFNHQLSWLSFQIQAAAGTGSEIAAIWGNVTSISILNLATTLTLNLPATPAFSGTGTINTFSASDSAPAALAIPANGSPAFFSQAMVQPQAYNSGISGNYQIQVVTTNGGTMTTPITITSNGTTVAGQKHLITLTFTESAITSTSTITAWTNGAAGSGSL